MEITAFRRALSFVVAIAATSCLAFASAPPVHPGSPAAFVRTIA